MLSAEGVLIAWNRNNRKLQSITVSIVILKHDIDSAVL